MEQTIISIPPEALLVSSNIRYGLKKPRVTRLADEIQRDGQINTPLEVFTLAETGPGGETYEVYKGHYRQAAAVELNKRGAGVECPCIVVERPDEMARTLGQISENMEREDLSIMDIAIAAKALLDGGMTKAEVCDRFVRAGGRKGNELKGISNSTLNIYLRCLDFPKSIQNKIHDGLLGTANILELQVAADKAEKAGVGFAKDMYEPILAQAEANRIKQVEADEKLDKKYEEEIRRQEEEAAKALKAQAEFEAAHAAKVEREKEVAGALDKANESYKATLTTGKDKEAAKKAAEAHKAYDNDAKNRQKLLDEAVKNENKAKEKLDKHNSAIEARKAKLKAAQEEATKKGKLDINKAASQVAGTGPVALTATEIRKAIADNALPSSFPKTQKVFQALAKMSAGTTTTDQCLSEVAWIVGERKARPAHVKEPKEANGKGKEAAAE